MTFEPTPTEVLFLMRLVFMGEEPSLSKTKPSIGPKTRRRLLNAGLIELEKRGRARHILATDWTWDWVFEHLAARLPARSTVAAPELLGTILPQLQAFLRANRARLVDFVRAERLQPAVEETEALLEAYDTPVQGLEQSIRSIYHQETGRHFGERLRLARLRARLPDVPRHELDEMLLHMQKRGRAVLYRLDDPREVFPADESAALHLLGNPRHILYLEA